MTFTRESILIEVGTSISGVRVARVVVGLPDIVLRRE
jgi:hypothetical protein